MRLAKQATREFLQTILPEDAIEKISHGELIAEFRIDKMQEDLDYLGAYDEMLIKDVEDYRVGILNSSIVNREALAGFNEDEDCWLAWDPDTDQRYLVPDFVVRSFHRTPVYQTQRPQAPWEK